MRRVLITGHSRGIGRALTEHYLAAGSEVWGVSRSTGNLSHRHLVEIAADLSSLETIKELVAKTPRTGFDLVFANAGINRAGPTKRTSVREHQELLDLNLQSPIHLVHALLTSTRLPRGSSLVLVSSLSHYSSYPGAALYAASKDGLAAFARNLRPELQALGIHTMCVFPGPIATDMARVVSPASRKDSARMQPAVLAKKIAKAEASKKMRYTPGFVFALLALVARMLPSLVESLIYHALGRHLIQRDHTVSSKQAPNN